MIKKQQRWIALFVALTFMWLLQVSTMPVAAAGTDEQVTSASAEQGPDYYEAIAQKVAPAKKGSMLPWILIGVGVVTVTAVVLFLFVLNKYDITGAWNFVLTFGAISIPYVITFSGTKKSGSFTTTGNSALVGTYTVDGKNVVMNINNEPSIPFTGHFTDKNTMSGTLTEGSITMNWTATRQ